MTPPPLQAPRRAIVFATSALEPLPELAADAERAGFQRVYTTEFPDRDAVARALAIALGTREIEVATGIAYAFTRLPVAMAALAADVQRLSGGRFALGLGSGTRGVRRWYDAEFDRPATRMAACAEALRRAWDEAPGLAEVGAPPLLGAALNPAMVRAAAGAFDGLLLHPLGIVREHLHRRVLPEIERGAAARDTRPTLAAWCITAIAADEELARDHARRQLAFYLSTPTYGSVVEGTPHAAAAERIREAFAASERRATWAQLAPLVPDVLVDEVTLAGPPDVVAERADRLGRELAPLGVGELVFQTIGADVPDEEVVENCAHIISVLGRRVRMATEARRAPA